MPCIFCNNTDYKSGAPHVIMNDNIICSSCAIEITRGLLSIDVGTNSILSVACLLELYRRKRKALPKSLRDKIIKKYKGVCQNCRCDDPRKLSIDHIKPFSRGGPDTETNLTVLCRSCNSKKGAKLLSEVSYQMD